jgi:predicted nuclease of predicted toxin-antitoxin system
MSRLLLNENLPASLAATLAAEGFPTLHVRDLDLCGKSDLEIWGQAQREDCVIVTKDADYLDLAVTSGTGRVVLIAIGNAGNKELTAFMLNNLPLLREFMNGNEQVVVLSR